MNARTHALSQIALLVSALAALFVSSLTNAHHSPAAFDTTKSMTITGVVTKYEWFNPHVYITIEQTSSDGKKTEWEIESFPPSMMARLGWTRETLRAGDALTITGSPGRATNSRGLLAGTIKRADSTILSVAMLAKQFAPAADAPKFAAKGLEGIWDTQTSVQVITQSAFPNAADLTNEGAEIFKRFDEKTMSPGINCIPGTAPGTMVMPELKRIKASEGKLEIHSEFDGAQRTIHLDQTSHEGAIPSHQGHSIGKWQGKTLHIDTTHFAYHGAGNGIGLPSGSKKHLVERLTLSADGASITYQFEMTDPQYLKAPRTGELKFVFRPDMKFAPEPCNLDSARRFIQH